MKPFRSLFLAGMTALTMALLLAACAPTAALNALAPASTHTRTADLPYGPLPRQRLDVYTPRSPGPADGWPVVVFLYGGSWDSGDRSQYQFVGEALASKGVLTVVADYRLYPEVRYPDFLQDCARAVAYGLSQARAMGGDPKRVYVMGHSAGAYNAAMLALDERWLGEWRHRPQELAGFIGLAGPYDFLPIENQRVRPVFFHPNYPPGTQPMAYAGPTAPRTFLAAATEDRLVDPERNSAALAQRLQAAGVPVTMKRYDRANHLTLIGAFGRPLRWLAPVLDDTVAFIRAERPETQFR